MSYLERVIHGVNWGLGRGTKNGPISADPLGFLDFLCRQCNFQVSWQLVGEQDPQSPSLGTRLRPVIDTEFAVDVAGVDLDRVQREEKPGSDLWIGQPFGDELEYLNFALAQRLDHYRV